MAILKSFQVFCFSVITITALLITTAASLQAAPRSFNFRVNPIGPILGVYGLDADIGVLDALTIGPGFAYLAATSGIAGAESKLIAYQISAHATWYPRGKRLSDGWYATARGGFIPVRISKIEENVEFTGSMNSFSAGALGGFQWFWETGFNLTLGAGADYYAVDTSVTATSAAGAASTVNVPSFHGLLPALELSIGWAF